MTPAAVYLSEACRLWVLLVLAAAVAGKAAARQDLADTIAALFPLRDRGARVAAVLVLAVEGLSALLLLAGGAWARAGMAAALALFLAFTAVLLVALVQRKAVRCTCFGGRGHPISAWDLLRNGALIAACAVHLRQGPLAHPLDPAAWLLLFGTALILLLISANLAEIARFALGGGEEQGGR